MSVPELTSEEITQLLADHPAWALAREGKAITRTFQFKDFSQASYGAFFAEVRVNDVTGEVRVDRMLGAFGFGRVLNAKTARSQCIGGMVWGIGSALTEELAFDSRDGHLVNHDLAEYHVPVHAEHVDAAVRPAVGLEAFEALARVVQHMRGRVDLDRPGGTQFRLAPFAIAESGHRHVVGQHGAEGGPGLRVRGHALGLRELAVQFEGMH